MFASDFGFYPWRELQRLEQEAQRALEAASGHRTVPLHSEGFPLNIAVSEEGAQITAILPGASANDFDVSILGETLTLKGRRSARPLKEGETYHRRERPSGAFARVVQLPFRADGEEVEARYKNGILQLRVPRAAADRPRRIDVQSVNA